MRTAKEVAEILDAHTGVSFSVGATGWDVLPDAVAHLKCIAELEAALQPFSDFSDHVTDDGNHEVARVRYPDGTFGALFGDQFHAARTVLRKK